LLVLDCNLKEVVELDYLRVRERLWFCVERKKKSSEGNLYNSRLIINFVVMSKRLNFFRNI